MNRRGGVASGLARRGLLSSLCLGLLSLGLLGFLSACQQTRSDTPAALPVPQKPALRVGVSGHFPPLIYNQADGWAGIEIDLARRLSERLERPLEIVSTRWNQLIPALLDGRIDMIMSGMTITDARKVRIAFSDPYLRTGLYAMMRAEDRRRYGSVRDILAANANVGVVAETTGDVFLQQKMPQAARWAVSKAEAAPFELRNHRIDLFIYDAPSVMWLVSENEADLAALPEFLDREYLGWGIRRGDHRLLGEVNAALKAWKADGSLEQILSHWLPYQKELW